jgi:hypothetical protein
LFWMEWVPNSKKWVHDVIFFNSKDKHHHKEHLT